VLPKKTRKSGKSVRWFGDDGDDQPACGCSGGNEGVISGGDDAAGHDLSALMIKKIDDHRMAASVNGLIGAIKPGATLGSLIVNKAATAANNSATVTALANNATVTALANSSAAAAAKPMLSDLIVSTVKQASQ
jgi:hypothetical protein